MKYYLASRYGRRWQLKQVATELRQMGHVVTSRWLETEFANKPNESSAAPPELRQEYALIDLEDVREADCVVSFTELPGQGSRGGRHVEFGYGLALGKTMIVIGHRENLFHEHPEVVFFESTHGFLRTCSHV